MRDIFWRKPWPFSQASMYPGESWLKPLSLKLLILIYVLRKVPVKPTKWLVSCSYLLAVGGNSSYSSAFDQDSTEWENWNCLTLSRQWSETSSIVCGLEKKRGEKLSFWQHQHYIRRRMEERLTASCHCSCNSTLETFDKLDANKNCFLQ